MCCTLEIASLSSTLLLAHQVVHEGKLVNVLGYQNTAKNYYRAGPNAMILPIPSAVPMSAANVIDMTGTEGLLEGYEKIVRPPPPPVSEWGWVGPAAAAGFDSIEVFDSGSYTVVLTKDVRLRHLREVLAKLPQDKRPDLRIPQMKIFRAFRDLYPDWHLAICIWKGWIKAEPLLWWYEPMPQFVGNHFLPGLDAHDGNPPDLRASVSLDHTLIVGKKWPSTGNAESLVDSAPAHVRKWLPRHVVGEVLQEQSMPNGDWIIPKDPAYPFVSEKFRVTPGSL